MSNLSACCIHCGQAVIERAWAIGKAEIARLRDHLLGCPAALAACSPALPVFDRASDVLRHVRVDAPRG